MPQDHLLKNFPSWMVCLRPEPFESKLFGSRSSGGQSTFYTKLDTSDDQADDSSAAAAAAATPAPVVESDRASGSNRNSRLLEQQSAASEDGNSQDSDSLGGLDEQSHYPRHSFCRIASFGGFPKFRPFVMSTSATALRTSTELSQTRQTTLHSTYSKMSHSVIEYRSSRYASSETSYQNEYAVSESESEEESEEARSSETDSAIVADHADEPPIEKRAAQEERGGRASSVAEQTKRAHHVVQELLSTEKRYVSTLYLIDQVFQFRVDQENRAYSMFPPETVQHVFANVKSIYKFHQEFLLPQLEVRIEAWDADPRIGDIMKNFAPFLKMYTEYVKNFDSAINLMTTLQQKVARFAAIVNDIQKMEECAKLSLAHHMLSPIQRLPRYELLLKDYLRSLTEDSPDYEDTKKALELVSTAANHTNEAMKKIDKFKKLLEIQESIYDSTDLVSATRELVKEGRIVKISARSGDHQERYMYLFSDMLLLCSLRLIPGPLYRLRAKFTMDKLQVIEGDNLETANTFYLRDENKSVELYTHSAADKAAWLDALFETMQEIMRRKASLKQLRVVGGADAKSSATAAAGVTPRAEDTTRCMVCEALFSVMKRRHHCRACGIVVCSKCSNQKLTFEDNKSMRVCRLCHAALSQQQQQQQQPQPEQQQQQSTGSSSTGDVKSAASQSSATPGLLQVSASAASVLSGYLLLKTQAGKPWQRRWFALHHDYVLYTFKSEAERAALTATPMPGFTVTDASELPGEDPLSAKGRVRAFKIHHSRKCYYLQAPTDGDKQRWLNILQLATKAELPQTTDESASAQPESQ